MAAKFEIVKDERSKYHFYFRASNGDTIVSSEAYADSKTCYKGIALLQKNASKAKIVDPEAEELAKIKAERAKKTSKSKPGKGRGRPPKNTTK